MALNFPSSPSEGTIFRPGSGLHTYVYRSGVWVKFNGTASNYNKIINPSFQISQEYVDAVTAISHGSHTCDMWQMNLSTSAIGTHQRLTNTPTPDGSYNRLRVSITTGDAAIAASDFFHIQTRIEGKRCGDLGWATTITKPVVLRFGFKSPNVGTYSFSLCNNGASRSYVGQFTTAANVDTIYTFAIPGDTLGTWLFNENVGIVLNISLAVGATYQGAAGWQAGTFWGLSSNSNGLITGAIYELFDVGLYADPYNTGLPPPFQHPTYEDDLHDCKRYWYRSHGGFQHGVVNTATTINRAGCNHPVVMRVLPILSVVGAAMRTYDGTAVPVVTSVGNAANSERGLDCVLTASAGGLTVGRPGMTLSDSVETNYLAVNARL